MRALFRSTHLLCLGVLLGPACRAGDSQIVSTRTVSGTVDHDTRPTRREVFELDDFALYVPAEVATARGLILALGGPDTRAFVTGVPTGAPSPELEASLQTLGQELRRLAASHGLAVLGTSQRALPDSSDSDRLLLEAVQTAAAESGRPELAGASVLLYGISGGGPQASSFAARNPERTAGLLLNGPAAVTSVTGGSALLVPTYMLLAELDTIVDNAELTKAFDSSRRAGALWGLAVEPQLPHHSLSPAERRVTVNWIRTILELRLPAGSSEPLREIDAASGWLGDRSTGKATPWATYRGDRESASWLPSQATAEDWESFVAPSR